MIVETENLNTSTYNECRYSVASVSLSRGLAHKVSLTGVYRCRDGVKRLTSRYVLGILTSLALLLCLVVIAYNECRYRDATDMSEFRVLSLEG